MTALRFRWRTLVAVVLAVVWIVGVYRYLRRDASLDPASVTTYVPVASPPQAKPGPRPAAAPPAAAPTAPAAPVVAPTAPAASAVIV
jgi:hypothetical protein